jgi:hypothetical protein
MGRAAREEQMGLPVARLGHNGAYASCEAQASLRRVAGEQGLTGLSGLSGSSGLFGLSVLSRIFG